MSLVGSLQARGLRSSGGTRHPIGPTISAITAHEPTISARISSAVQCRSEYPSATALLAECSAMHGYSDPVRHRTMQSMKPRKPSGIRYCDEAEPVWTRPNRIPVITAAMNDAEVTAGDHHPHLAQRPEQEAAEEELLADRRDRADEHGRHHDRRVVVGVAQLRRELVLAVQVEHERVDVGDDVVDDRGDHEAWRSR